MSLFEFVPFGRVSAIYKLVGVPKHRQMGALEGTIDMRGQSS